VAGRGDGIIDVALVRALKYPYDVPGIGRVQVFLGLAGAGFNPLTANEVLESFCRH